MASPLSPLERKKLTPKDYITPEDDLGEDYKSVEIRQLRARVIALEQRYYRAIAKVQARNKKIAKLEKALQK
jgi:hypothetical protein